MKNENHVPIEKVIDDMYSDGVISSAARDYYYIHYASKEEKETIDFEKKLEKIIACIAVTAAIISCVSVILQALFSGCILFFRF